MKKKKSNYYIIISALLSSFLFGCSHMEQVHEKQGYNVKVTYDLGEGYFARNDKEYHELILYYKSGTPITDISKVSDYKNICYSGYELEGFCFDKTLNDIVDFENYILPNDVLELTLYANWKESIKYCFNVYYNDLENENEIKFLANVSYSPNKEFTLAKAKVSYPSSDEYTCVGLYKDEEMLEKIDKDYLLDNDHNELNVYSKWIKGNYKVITSEKEFNRYVGSNNLYLDTDLDFSSVSFIRPITLSNKIILGNNHVIRNISLNITDTSKNNEVTGLFVQDKISDCIISDLTFENCSYVVDLAICKMFYLGGLSGNLENSQISNVSFNASVTFSSSTLERYENEKLKIKSEVSYFIDENSKISNSKIEINDLRKG